MQVEGAAYDGLAALETLQFGMSGNTPCRVFRFALQSGQAPQSGRRVAGRVLSETQRFTLL